MVSPAWRAGGQWLTLVDEPGDSLHTATTGETANGGLGDTPDAIKSASDVEFEMSGSLDVVTEHLPVSLGTALAETFAACERRQSPPSIAPRAEPRGRNGSLTLAATGHIDDYLRWVR